MIFLSVHHNADEGRGLPLGTTVLVYFVRMRLKVLVNRKEAKVNSDSFSTIDIRVETSNRKIMSYF